MHDTETYQWKLRALGAYLDIRHASHVSIIETPSGFGIRYFENPLDREPVFVHLDEVRLGLLVQNQLRRRTSVPVVVGAAPESTTTESTATPASPSRNGSYQDFFRALGWELDDMHAGNIVIDEQEDGMFVSYACFVPNSGHIWRKRVTKLGPDERKALLSEAYSRRRAG